MTELEQLRALVVSQQQELAHRDTVLREFMSLTGTGAFYDGNWWFSTGYDPKLMEAFTAAHDAITRTKDLVIVMDAINTNEILRSQWLRLLATMRLAHNEHG